MNLPVMEAIDFIREFRKVGRFTPIIVVSTESGDSKMSGRRKPGASGWLVKPFRPDELIHSVNKLII